MINYEFENNYKHEIINGVEYVYIWNNPDLKYPYLPNKSWWDIKYIYSEEQIKEIDETIFNYPLTGEEFYNNYRKDCIDVKKLNLIFAVLSENNKIEFLKKITELKMPNKYIRMLKKVFLTKLRSKYNYVRKEVLNMTM